MGFSATIGGTHGNESGRPVLPLIDLEAPEKWETATFAFG